ncbi:MULTISPECIES: hypothetical protein [unclassified Roseovarius]|uniref:hypothetical protein n=1 Tax=unclassified Roseovarius TaxID=2614913 RepID=UPI00273D8B5A|nr:MULTISPECIES: hypothetical protein [unclassified Roseovarius]
MTSKGETKQHAEELFEQFLKFDALGMRKEAKRAVSALIKEVSDNAAKDRWTKVNLSRMPRNRASRVRHEIFKEIVFPSLKAAFDRGEAEASYLFGKYSQNLYSDRALFNQLDQRTALELFREAFDSDPSSTRYQSAYLGALLGLLRYSFHEWPTGILIDHDDWRKGLDGMRAQLSLARSLDRNSEYSGLFAQWFAYVDEYEARLSADNSSH